MQVLPLLLVLCLVTRVWSHSCAKEEAKESREVKREIVERWPTVLLVQKQMSVMYLKQMSM